MDKEKGILYVADAYYGLFKIDILKGIYTNFSISIYRIIYFRFHKGTKTLILSSNDKRFGTAKLKLVDDLDLDGDVIYFLDSSYERDYSEFLEEHIEALPRGRLFRYNQTSDELEFLIENLYFPNGLQLTPNKDAILINENTMARIIKYLLPIFY
jgi:sugar lactone lactonase YvrE